MPSITLSAASVRTRRNRACPTAPASKPAKRHDVPPVIRLRPRKYATSKVLVLAADQRQPDKDRDRSRPTGNTQHAMQGVRAYRRIEKTGTCDQPTGLAKGRYVVARCSSNREPWGLP